VVIGLMLIILSQYFHNAFGIAHAPALSFIPPIQPPDDACQSPTIFHPPFDYNFDEGAGWLISHLEKAGYTPRYSHLSFIDESDKTFQKTTDVILAFYTFLRNRNINYTFSHVDDELFLRWLESSDFILVTSNDPSPRSAIERARELYSRPVSADRSWEMLGSHAKLVKLMNRLHAYPVVGDMLIRPFNLHLFLLQKPPHRLEDAVTMDAADFHRGNVWLRIPQIGNDSGLDVELTGHQVDVKFPDDRYTGTYYAKLRFAEYDMEARTAGTWDIQLEYASPHDAELNVEISGYGSAAKIHCPATHSFSRGSEKWTAPASLGLHAGRNTLRLWAETPWPRVSAITLRKRSLSRGLFAFPSTRGQCE